MRRAKENRKRRRIRITIYILLGMMMFITGFFHFSNTSNAEDNSVETRIVEKNPEKNNNQVTPVTLGSLHISANPSTGATESRRDELKEEETTKETLSAKEPKETSDIVEPIETKSAETEKVKTESVETEAAETEAAETKVVETESVETEVIEVERYASAETEMVETEVAEPEEVEETFFEEPEIITTQEPTNAWNGPVLNSYVGTVQGPSGKETYYNMDMSGIVSSIENRGWLWNDIASEYQGNVTGGYWIRDDGVKMYGDYIMVAANLDVHPRGSLVETSLGTGVVLDTGGFAAYNIYQIDIAVNW